MTTEILGYEVFAGTVEECAQSILDSIFGSEERRWLACLNPHSYVVAKKDVEFRHALKSADWLVPDGTGIVLGSRILGGSVCERVAGPDVFQAVMQGLEQRGGGRVYFLGSTEKVLSQIRINVAEDWPLVDVVGSHSPPFKARFSSAENETMVRHINALQPDVLWVGLAAPKQEKWIQEVLRSVEVPFIAAVGATFDFYSGQVKRSGKVFRRFGLEWLPRLIRQPKRLWHRTLVSAPIFLIDIVLARFGVDRSMG